jgi:hypothetical protein
MKELINEVVFVKERETPFGTLYDFKVKYDDKVAFYSSKSKDQKKFIAGQEAEFTEEEIEYKDKKTGEPKTFLKIKPLNPNKQSNFGKALKREQSKYSGFAVSYAKDLVVAGRLQREELADYAWVLFELMVEMDKSIES